MTAPVLPLDTRNSSRSPIVGICQDPNSLHFCFRINKIHGNVLTCRAFIHSARPYTMSSLRPGKAKNLDGHIAGFFPL